MIDGMDFNNNNIPQSLPPMNAAEKYAANIAAIRILKTLETEKREANTEEWRALALYTGWGDTEVRRRAFQWHGGPASEEIASLGLSEEALDAMRRSALNAHYTELGVVRALWEVALHLGLGELRGPRVLEPSCGVGHFLGLAPYGESDLAPERLVGVELDDVSAAIARALYPRCDVRRGGFEEQDLPASFDLAIGNVPFGDYRVSDERLPDGCRRQIHDYFVCRCVDLLRPGGVAVLITSKGTLDKESAFVRRWLAERAELLGAFRMPCDAFEENAGTQVTADVLVLQRLPKDQPGREPEWVGLEPVRFVGQHGQETEDRVNAYWLSHPDHVLGEWCQNKLVWRPDAGVRRREGDERPVADMIRALIPRLPANVFAQGPRERKAAARPTDERGELVLRTPQELAVGRLLRAVRACVAADGPGPRRLLRTAYDGYVRQHGRVRSAEHRKHPVAHLARERWWPLVASCEDDHGREAGFLVGEVRGEVERVKPETAADAMYQMLDERGSFDLAGVAERLGCDEVAARGGLRGIAYQLGPNGAWETAERYLSGDVVGKLDEARRWASLDAAFAQNVEALERSLPKPVPLVDVAVPLGTPWVPAKVYDDFLRHLFPAYWGYGATLKYVAETGSWAFDVTDSRVLGSVENTRTYGTGRMTAVDLIECALKLQVPTVFDDLPGDPRRVRNEPESAAAQAKLAAIRDKWAAWLPRDEARAKLLEETYNHRFNRVRLRAYNGSRLSFPKLSPTFRGVPIAPYAHQLAGAQRILERGEKDDTTLLTFAPGLGKTLAAILGLVKRLQLGLSDKVVIVVPKSVLGQWQATFYELYPQLADWLLPGTDKAFDAQNRRRFLLQAAGGGAKIVLLTYEQFRAVSLRPETFTAYLRREVSDLAQALTAVDEGDPSHKPLERAFKAREKALADFEAKYRDKWVKVEKAGESDLSWERWCEGRRVCLCVDEFHSYKSDVFMSRMVGVSGLPRGESQRAFDMRVKLHYVTTPELFTGLSLREEGKAVGLTGTPVTNSLAETWVMLRHLQPRLLREVGCWHFDAWAATFTSQVSCPEMDATGSWRVRTRLKFHNLPELQDLLGLCWDRVDPRKAGGKRPAIVGERMRVVETEGSEELRAYTRELADRAELVKKRAVDPSEDNMLKITHDGRVASVFNGVPSEMWPTNRVTKLDACAREVWDLYCHSDEASGVQLVFCDLFTPKAGSGEDAASLTSAEQFAQQGVYGVLRDKIVSAGVLPREVAYVHDAASDEERAELFRRANAGEVRVLIGSTARMGLGVNVQRRAYAVHHLTVPWRPDWLDQANKRVDRDGNTMDAVHIICYPTTGSYDVVLWQMIETKANFVAAIGSGTYGGRTADDIGDLVIDATTAKAIALGDLRVVEKVKLELELSVLQRQHKAWKVEHIRSRWELESLPRQIAEKDEQVADLERLKSVRDTNQLRSFSALLRPLMEPATPAAPSGASPSASWQPVTDRSRADAHVRELASSLRHKLNEDGTLVGIYRGLELRLVRDPQGLHAVAGLSGGAEVKAQNVHMPGTLCFVALETALAGLETQIRRLSVQRSVLSSRLDSLRADAPSWPHAERAVSLLSRYDDLCAAVATAGIVDRQRYSFS